MSDYASYDEDDLDDDFGPEDAVHADREPLRPNRDQRRRAEKAQRRAERRTLDDGTEVVALDYDGETYWLPADPTDWPADALLAFEDGKAMTALREILVPDENGNSGFELLRSKKYRVRDLNAIFDKAAKVGGFGSSGN